jgi:hypothetical protein
MACRGSSSWSLGSQIWEGDMSQLAGHLCSHNVPIFVSWSQASTIFCIIFPRWITFPPPVAEHLAKTRYQLYCWEMHVSRFPGRWVIKFCLACIYIYIHTYKLYMVLACLRPINPRLSPWNHPCKIYLNVCSAQCWWVNSYRQVGPSSLYLYGIRLAKNKNQRSPHIYWFIMLSQNNVDRCCDFLVRYHKLHAHGVFSSFCGLNMIQTELSAFFSWWSSNG